MCPSLGMNCRAASSKGHAAPNNGMHPTANHAGSYSQDAVAVILCARRVMPGVVLLLLDKV